MGLKHITTISTRTAVAAGQITRYASYSSSMKTDDAIAVARGYATSWGVPWGAITKTVKRRAWWLLFAVSDFTFFFATEHGAGEVQVSRPKWTVTRFEFFPTDPDHYMVPLWAAYPCYDSVTIGWRMGYGEDYKYRWHAWYRGLSDEKRSGYKERFPPPQDEDLCWHDFYDLIADVPGDPNSISDVIMGRVPANDT
jgi:hypothetical protein